jgi:cytosine deaminase
MGRFASLRIPESKRYWIHRARIPASLLAAPIPGASADADGGLSVDLLINAGAIAAIVPAQSSTPADPPALVDLHTHLEKGHTVTRSPNVDGSMAGALKATDDDRPHWTAEDIELRMSFGMRCAYVHGVGAIRSHIHSDSGQEETIWRVARKIRECWSDRLALQLVSLTPFETYGGDEGTRLANLVAESGGILGGVNRTKKGVPGPLEELDALLDRIFQLAAERDLDIDLHVDETKDPRSRTLSRVAQAVSRNRFKGKVVCGHCCSLAVQTEADQKEIIRQCADAGIAIVTLPHVNLYLQDRVPGRTPQWRGITLLHEMRRAGISVAVGGDNCRDGLYAYGDHDMVESWCYAVRIFHLDHPFADAPSLAGPVPAEIMGLKNAGYIGQGMPARFILFAARSLNELICRPHGGRIVVDRGRPVVEELPDYEELDAIMAR